MAVEITPELLKKRRTEKDLSQQDVADYIGVTQRAYGMYEDGSRKPKQEKINKLIEILELKNSTNVFMEPEKSKAPAQDQGDLFIQSIHNLTESIRLIEQNRLKEAENQSRLIALLESRSNYLNERILPDSLNDNLTALQNFVVSQFSIIRNIPEPDLNRDLGKEKRILLESKKTDGKVVSN